MCTTAGCQCSWGAGKAVSPLVEFTYTAMLGSIIKAPETIAGLGFLRLQSGNFWTVTTIYHNLQRT